MISPSPTQKAPVQAPEQKKVSSTPVKLRAGQTPAARFVKNIFRPILKGIYYTLQWIRGHKLLTLVLILVLLVSSFVTNYFVTGAVPFVTNDPLQRIAVVDPASANNIGDWLHALRNGNVDRLNALQAQMLQSTTKPDPTSLVSQYSQPQTGKTWKAITVLGIQAAAGDAGLDSFVEIDLSGAHDATTVGSVLVIHFTTVPRVRGGIFMIDVLPPRLIQVVAG